MTACIHSSRTQIVENFECNQIYAKFCRQDYPDQISCKPISKITINNYQNCKPISEITINNHQDQNQDRDDYGYGDDDDGLWLKMKDEARSDIDQEPILSTYYLSLILAHSSLESALANYISIKLSTLSLSSAILYDLIMGVITDDEEIVKAVKQDLKAVKERDPACISYVHCFLNFKGFIACQANRIAHYLWLQDRKTLALLIQSRVSEVFDIDIHPGARIGSGIMLDHGSGIVIGETAVIGNNVSILHNVTLGGTGKSGGDRHPKIGDGVLIGAGTCVLGNIVIGEGAKIGAGSVVLKDVPARTTAVGNPAKLIGGKKNPIKLDRIPSVSMDHMQHVNEWSDYVI